MKLIRFRRPALRTVTGLTRLKKRAKTASGLTALMRPLRWWTNRKRRFLRSIGYESTLWRALRNGVPGLGGCGRVKWSIPLAAEDRPAGRLQTESRARDPWRPPADEPPQHWYPIAHILYRHWPTAEEAERWHLMAARQGAGPQTEVAIRRNRREAILCVRGDFNDYRLEQFASAFHRRRDHYIRTAGVVDARLVSP